jgi:coenzyme Q-binding protein COQ10
MHEYNNSKYLDYSSDKINAIILDVEKYPEFLPWCDGARLISQEEGLIYAELKANFKGFTETYTSRVKHYKKDNIFFVEVEAVDGPFKYLYNNWEINPTNKESIVSFHIKYEFKSRIIDMLSAKFFQIAALKIIDAFEKRAEYLNKNTTN